MNDDLKPGGSGIALGDDRRLRHAAAQAAFTLAGLVALRVRDNSASEGIKFAAAADVIANEIRELAQSWAQAETIIIHKTCECPAAPGEPCPLSASDCAVRARMEPA
jgi:hypothetical protein